MVCSFSMRATPSDLLPGATKFAPYGDQQGSLELAGKLSNFHPSCHFCELYVFLANPFNSLI